MKKKKKYKSGYVALIGRTNVGKSTFLNRILGEKVSIVTPKPQTTRDKILGILSLNGGQIIFIDTPGIHETKKILNKKMVREAISAVYDADIILLMIEATHSPDIDVEDEKIIRIAEESGKNTFLLINKIDLVKKEYLLPLMESYGKRFNFTHMIPVCSLTAEGFDILTKLLLENLKESQAFFPEDQLTDKTIRFLCAEVIREKVFLLTHQEIPYSTAVKIEQMKEEGNLYRISATIILERDSQKGIVIGKGGNTLKQIGTLARKEIESSTGKKVFLSLFVKVEPDWTESEKGFKKVFAD